MPLPDDEFEAIRDRLCAAALGFEPWDDVLRSLARAIRADGAAPPREDAGGGSGGRGYFEHLAGARPLAPDAADAPLGPAVAPPEAEHSRAALRADWARPERLDPAAGARVGDAEGCVAGPAPTRLPTDGGSGAPEIALRSHQLLPLLRRGLSVYRTLAEAGALDGAFADALDRVRRGVFVVGAAGAILLANGLARALLAEPGGALRSERGALTAARARDAAALQRAMALAASGSAPPPCVLARPGGALPLVAEALPVRNPEALAGLAAPAAPRLLLLVTDPARGGEPSAAAVKAVFGATDSEAAVAVRVAKGESVPAVAAALGVSAATVRTHLNKVFEKTGTRRQAELAWLLARLPPR